MGEWENAPWLTRQADEGADVEMAVAGMFFALVAG